MKTINVKHTYDLNPIGEPSESCETLSKSSDIGVCPIRLKGLKLKLQVKQGDTVAIGSVLCYDKKNEKNIFLSPASGTVKHIDYGPRRVVNAIIIDSDKTESALQLFEPLTENNISKQNADDIAALIQKGGLWSSFTEYPFQTIPQATARPPAIYISLDNDEPYLPQSQVYLDTHTEDFLLGLEAIKRLCPTVHVAVAKKTKLKDTQILQRITHHLKGAYPANNPGVFLYHNKESKSENKAWGMKGQDVVQIGKLLKTGQYPHTKTIVLAGRFIKNATHLQVQEGTPIKDIVGKLETDKQTRIVCGGILTGAKASLDSYLSYNETAVHVLEEGKEQELLTFFRPGADKPTFSRTYTSALSKATDWVMTTSLNGGDRACISCSLCPKACPVDLYPQLIMKHLEVNDIETAMEQGFLDCVQCGLCTYVCPSKINMDTLFHESKALIAKEAGHV